MHRTRIWLVAALGACSTESTGTAPDGSGDALADAPVESPPDAAGAPDQMVGDTSDTAGPSPPPASATVWLEPLDGSTAVKAAALRLRIAGPIKDPAVLGQLAAAVRLRTFPEAAAVDFDTAISTPANAPDQRLVQVTPRAPLVNRWYLLDVSALPAGLTWPVYPSGYQGMHGGRGARFRAGSQPTLLRIRLCEKAGGAQKLTIGVSEAVSWTGGQGELPGLIYDKDEKTAVPCQPLPMQPPIHEYDFSCEGLVRPAPANVLRISANLRSQDLRTIARSVTLRIDLASLRPVESSCVGASFPVEVPNTGSCAPGASDNDCAACGAAPSTICPAVCPRADCSVYPPPPECQPLCARSDCCECLPDLDRHVWRSANAGGCGNACRGMRESWQDLLAATPGLTACAQDSDCMLTSWPNFNGGPSVSGTCGKSVNRSAYQGAEAARLEAMYNESCTAEKIFDCVPDLAVCRAGKCALMAVSRDAGADL